MSTTLSKTSQELRDEFAGLTSRDDIARLLEITTKQLNFHLYVLPPQKRYRVFEIAKKSGELAKFLRPSHH